jgi:hypothetical protein
MLQITLIMIVICRMSAIWMQSGAFNEILEMIGKKENLPPMKVSDIFHVWPVYVLKNLFYLWNMIKVGCWWTVCH